MDGSSPDTVAVDEGSVRAAQVLQPDVGHLDTEDAMMAGNIEMGPVVGQARMAIMRSSNDIDAPVIELESPPRERASHHSKYEVQRGHGLPPFSLRIFSAGDLFFAFLITVQRSCQASNNLTNA